MFFALSILNGSNFVQDLSPVFKSGMNAQLSTTTYTVLYVLYLAAGNAVRDRQDLNAKSRKLWYLHVMLRMVGLVSRLLIELLV